MVLRPKSPHPRGFLVAAEAGVLALWPPRSLPDELQAWLLSLSLPSLQPAAYAFPLAF